MTNLKSIKIYVVSSFLMMSFLLFAPKVSADSGSDNAYKSIVKIYTYYENPNYELTLVATGSGVIINGGGTFLTNYHVIDVKDGFKNVLPTAYMVCLTIDTVSEPDCSYTAELVATDEDKDLAMLKIKSAGLSSKNNFNNLEMVQSSILKEGDAVQALGYPGLGGKTVTITTGTISGTTEKYSLSWLKTDALVSFGSSGGALINSTGELIGITSSKIGDLGYAIDITDIKSWISGNLLGKATVSTLQTRMNDFIQKQNSLKTTDVFSNDHIKITKPKDWTFDHQSENLIGISDKDSTKGSSVFVSWSTESDYSEPNLDTVVKTLELQGSYFSAGEAVLNGKKGRKLIYPISSSDEVELILIPNANHTIQVSYYYGKDGVDKAVIDDILGKITLTNYSSNFVPERKYEQKNPYFKINLPDGWSLMKNNSLYEPVGGQRISTPEISFSINIDELADNIRGLSKEKYFDFIKNDERLKYDIELLYGLKADRYFKSTDYKINDELSHEIFYKYKFKDEEDGDSLKYFAAGYRVIDGDRVVIINFLYIGEDQNIFEQYLSDFEKQVLVNLTFGRKVVKSTEEVKVKEEKKVEVKPTVVVSSSSEKTTKPTKNLTNNFSKKFTGKIVLEVEKKGEAWYFCPNTKKAYFLGRPDDAFSVMREQGVGISNADLSKIEIGLTDLSGEDTDKDGLSDMIEDAIGTNKNSADTDSDGINDRDEISKGITGKKIDKNFSGKQKGKIFLQIEGKGEAWYINPNDGKRYFLGRPADAFAVMRKLGLGMSNADFEKIN